MKRTSPAPWEELARGELQAPRSQAELRLSGDCRRCGVLAMRNNVEARVIHRDLDARSPPREPQDPRAVGLCPAGTSTNDEDVGGTGLHSSLARIFIRRGSVFVRPDDDCVVAWRGRARPRRGLCG